MSQEHPNSTPRRSYPKPVLAAFGSTGALQKKTGGFFGRGSTLSNTPETPLKSERSKFFAPLNLTPFALSPKMLAARSSSTPKVTRLQIESFVESNDTMSTFEDSMLNSPCQFSGNMSGETDDQAMLEDMFDQSFDLFVDNSTSTTSDMDMDMYSPSRSVSMSSDCAHDSAQSPYTEPWRSSKVNFLNEHGDATLYGSGAAQDAESADYFTEYFEILELIGHGSFSIVYKVRAKRDEAVYALKKTKLPFRGNIDRRAKIREVQHLWQARGCPHCVQIHSAWEQFGHLYILTEFCGNGSLKTLIDHLAELDERFTERSIWGILMQCAQALEFLHRHNIIHLDLKPENIFVGSDSQLKLGDFGISTTVGLPPSLHSEGDKYYMAPEVLEGVYSKAADVFSLGLIMLELAADVQLPSNGESWQNLRHGDYSELSFDDTSDMLNQLIREMTHPSPVQRPTIEKVLWRAQFFLEKALNTA